MIGRDGIGCEPASATTLAGIRKLVSTGELDKDENVVGILTGNMMKIPVMQSIIIETNYSKRKSQRQSRLMRLAKSQPGSQTRLDRSLSTRGDQENTGPVIRCRQTNRR